jgi:hypothetical protein
MDKRLKSQLINDGESVFFGTEKRLGTNETTLTFTLKRSIEKTLVRVKVGSPSLIHHPIWAMRGIIMPSQWITGGTLIHHQGIICCVAFDRSSLRRLV